MTEFGGLYGAGGIGSLTQPLLGERIQAALKPNRVVVVGTGDSLNVLAERHGTTVTTPARPQPHHHQPSVRSTAPGELVVHPQAPGRRQRRHQHHQPAGWLLHARNPGHLSGGVALDHLQLELQRLRSALREAGQPRPLHLRGGGDLAGQAA